MMEILFGESAAGGLVYARLCKSADVLSFALALDAGDIAQEGIGRARMDTLRALFSFAPDEIGEEAARHCFAAAKAGWESAKKRMLAGEEARLWTSAQPDAGAMCFRRILRAFPKRRSDAAPCVSWQKARFGGI